MTPKERAEFVLAQFREVNAFTDSQVVIDYAILHLQISKHDCASFMEGFYIDEVIKELQKKQIEML